EFVKYHDSDDVMYPHCLATMIEPLVAEPRAGLALSGSRSWPGAPCPMLLTPRLAYGREFLGAGLFHLGPASAMFRARVFAELGGFPEQGVASDYLFWMKACARVNVLLLPGDLFYYRIHDGQELTHAASELDYAKASGVAWDMLNAPDCPLDGAVLERAKRNWVFTVLRGAYRHVKRGRPRSPALILRPSHLGVAAGLRYARRPKRSPSAGTPADTQPAESSTKRTVVAKYAASEMSEPRQVRGGGAPRTT